MSVIQALACYVASFRKGALLALGGNSGNWIYDVRLAVSAPMLFLTLRLVLDRSRIESINRIF